MPSQPGGGAADLFRHARGKTAPLARYHARAPLKATLSLQQRNGHACVLWSNKTRHVEVTESRSHPEDYENSGLQLYIGERKREP